MALAFVLVLGFSWLSQGVAEGEQKVNPLTPKWDYISHSIHWGPHGSHGSSAGTEDAEPPAAVPPPVLATATQPTDAQPPAVPSAGVQPADVPPADEPPAHEPPADEPPADEPPADEPTVEELPADEPPDDEPPADVPPADEPLEDEPLELEPLELEPLPLDPLDDVPLEDEPSAEEPADEPPAEEPPAEKPPAAVPPAAEHAAIATAPPAGKSSVGEPPASIKPTNKPRPGTRAGKQLRAIGQQLLPRTAEGRHALAAAAAAAGTGLALELAVRRHALLVQMRQPMQPPAALKQPAAFQKAQPQQPAAPEQPEPTQQPAVPAPEQPEPTEPEHVPPPADPTPKEPAGNATAPQPEAKPTESAGTTAPKPEAKPKVPTSSATDARPKGSKASSFLRSLKQPDGMLGVSPKLLNSLLAFCGLLMAAAVVGVRVRRTLKLRRGRRALVPRIWSDKPSLTSNQMKLVWQMPGGSDVKVDQYDLERVPDGKVVYSGLETSHLEEGLAPSTRLKFRVRATVESNPGDWSSVVTETTPPLKPTVPDAPSLWFGSGGASVTAVKVIWSEPAANGPAISAYKLEKRQHGGDWELVCERKGTATHYLVEDLQPETGYDFRVAARNAKGWGAWSAECTSRTAVISTLKDQHVRVVVEGTDPLRVRMEVVPDEQLTQENSALQKRADEIRDEIQQVRNQHV